MKILIISRSWHYHHSFIYNLSRALIKLENVVILLDPFEKAKEFTDQDNEIYFEDLFYRVYSLPLSYLIEDYPDLDVILVENTKFRLYNDLHGNKPIVVYYHRDYMAPPQIYSPDILLYRYYKTELINLHRNSPDFLYDPKIKRTELFWHAINPNHFKLKAEKSLKGLVWAGLPKPIDFYVKLDSMHEQYYFRMKELLGEMSRRAIIDHYYETSESIEQYKTTLAQSEFALVIMPFNAFETRRLYEAAYLDAIPVIYVQNDTAKEVYEKMGFIHYENCIMFQDPEEVEGLHYLGEDLKNMMRERARELIDNRHTYEARALEFLEIVKRPLETKEHDYKEPKTDENLKALYDTHYFPFLDPTEENIYRAKRGFNYAKDSAKCILYDRLLRHYNEMKGDG